MKRMKILSTLAVATTLALLGGGCSTYKKGGAEAQASLQSDSQAAVQRFSSADPGLTKFFDSAYGYAIFPKITKGAAGIGVGSGEGIVIEKGDYVGDCSMTQTTIGAQLGGQTYSEIIFFQNKAALDVFKMANFEFSAQASAVAAEKGSAATADFQSGVAVFTLTRGGLMFEASVGGQKFSYYPKDR